MTEQMVDERAAGDPTGRPGRRGLLVSLLAVLLAVLLAGHRAVPNVRGLGSLVDSVTPLLGLGVPPLALAALLRRSRRALLAVLLPAVVWAALFGSAWLPSAASAGPTSVRVASQNLRSGNPDPAATVGALAGAEADLIGLQEVDDDDRVDAALRERYPHRAAVSTVALWSRWPIRDSVGVDTGLGWDRALRAVVAAPQGDLAVYVVHLGSARAGHTATRDETLAALAATVRTDPAPRLVVLGDLNTATTDRVFAPLTRLLHDAQADAGQGFGFTWPAELPVTRPDHVLYRGLTPTAAGVLQTPDSDHRAVTAGFRW
ncbi:endonuclease/exonuclease/phosphatase family protein [Micromonospora sp. DR5-3]|uniref:endonuclease/exonuclease/phosphatase family protein n=1 Tax=unclassified Micromonospora TaxID=2617518 RepID=UPI0021051F8E|nr:MULTISPECIES: endonuclease/exonuclease/phosphatase family protein [unclassified Micromonospora]MCW3818100.1 endonuclease/exonuclease/phosphatase family protein [Micromonospora sp. DR5-3]